MRWLPVILLLCLGVSIVPCLWNWSADPPPPTPAANLSTEGDDPAAQPTPAASVPLVNGADTEPTETDHVQESQRTDATAEAGRHGPRVRVVRGSVPQPVPDAKVFCITEPDADARRSAAVRQHPTIDTGHRHEWPARFGQRLSTDAEGVATLPPTRHPWLVAAVAEGEFAFATVAPGDRMVTLLLQTDETVIVRATGADGKPGRHLPVALLMYPGGKKETAVLWQGVTDREGELRCAHFQLLRPAARDAEPPERFGAMVTVPLPAPALALFEGRPTTGQPVLLQVPPLTSVEVTLTDHRGTPLLTPAGAVLWVEQAKDPAMPLPAPPFPIPAGLDRPRVDKPVGAVAVSFPLVAVGSPVRIGARFPNERRGVSSELLWTPALPSEKLTTKLPLGPDLALLAGRIVGPDGEPFGDKQVSGCIWRSDGPIGEIVVSTTADGRFDLVCRPVTDAAELWLELRARWGPPAAAPDGSKIDPVPREVGARVRFLSVRAAERRELGVIVLGELPPMATGLVVDDVGAPVADAEVNLQRHATDVQAALANVRYGNPPATNQERDPWRDVPLQSVRTDAAGTFQLLGELPPGPLRIRADTNRHFADSVPLHTGGQQVRIVLLRNGILRGRVLLPEWIADGSVTLTLRPFDESLRERDTRTLGLKHRNGGRFTLEPLRPGRFDAIVAVRNVREPLAVLADVFVTPGEVRDNRLQPLDLRNALFRYRLRAVDEGRRQLALDGPILARLRQQDGSLADAGFRWQRGRAELITGSSMAELVAFGKGFEPTTITLSPGDHDIFMRQVVPAKIMLPSARALCGPERRVRVSVVLTDETGFPQWLQGIDQRTGESFSFPRWELGKSTGAWLLASDLVEVPIARSGKYEVVLRLHATDSERSPQASVPLGVHELRADGSAVLPVTVAVDAQKVADAIASLQQQQQELNRQQQQQKSVSGRRTRGNVGR